MSAEADNWWETIFVETIDDNKVCLRNLLIKFISLMVMVTSFKMWHWMRDCEGVGMIEVVLVRLQVYGNCC